MARLQFTANTPDNNEGLEDFTPIPAGDVFAIITKSGYRQTKKKDGNYLQLLWKVVVGKNRGRTLFDNLNLDNPNPIAVEIANKSLNSICKACQKVGVQDSEELHGIPCKLTISVQPATATQPASNQIKAYKAITPDEAKAIAEAGSDAPTPAVLGQAATEAVPAAVEAPPVTKKLPWEE